MSPTIAMLSWKYGKSTQGNVKEVSRSGLVQVRTRGSGGGGVGGNCMWHVANLAV